MMGEMYFRGLFNTTRYTSDTTHAKYDNHKIKILVLKKNHHRAK